MGPADAGRDRPGLAEPAYRVGLGLLGRQAPTDALGDGGAQVVLGFGEGAAAGRAGPGQIVEEVVQQAVHAHSEHPDPDPTPARESFDTWVTARAKTCHSRSRDTRAARPAAVSS